ncbi:DNA cytosine methyltransferase [Achromobacter sp. MY14]|uniref:DNA cytosine methyltransferase n=1 Tax=unclassified Achromobacter TaxID=2626865 RepID=UPI001E6412DE|nr:DNA cytosine methyltransferase [Achromobacter sp. MY14]MCD0495944.1 DNA cytosine methyltransferase [Achromobacter sp. MY14]
MIRDQFVLDINEELIIDNFAGGGGASTGIELALGRCVDVAINHDAEAIAMHSMNHPQTRHYCESVWDVDPLEVTKGRPVGLGWFSPDCKHFSKAKGGKPREKRIRGLAWVVLRWAALVRPRVIMLENVEEFRTWGPLLESGQPCPLRKGKTFRSFIHQLQEKGYRVEHRELRACDYGAPTIRKRLFLIARCDGQPIVWPSPTHGAPTSPDVVEGRLQPWRTAADCIDWSIPCPSIFERARPLAGATMKRIARGIRRYVLDSAAPFIVKCNHTSNRTVYDCFRGSGIHEPLKTVTASHGMAVVAPYLTEHANGSTQRNFPADEPLRTQCAEVKGGHFAVVAPTLIQTGYGEREGQAPRALDLGRPLGTVTAQGGKHALVSAFMAKHYGGGYEGAGAPLDGPAHTITTADHHALVTSNLIKLRGECTGSAAGEPVATVTAGGTHVGEVRAFLVKYYGQGGQDQSAADQMHTIPTKDRLGLVTVAGQEYQIADIGMRMLEPHELYAAQGFPQDYIIAPTINGRRLPKHAQVRMCGNSVCPPLAAALVRANLPEMASWSRQDAKLQRISA